MESKCNWKKLRLNIFLYFVLRLILLNVYMFVCLLLHWNGFFQNGDGTFFVYYFAFKLFLIFFLFYHECVGRSSKVLEHNQSKKWQPNLFFLVNQHLHIYHCTFIFNVTRICLCFKLHFIFFLPTIFCCRLFCGSIEHLKSKHSLFLK